MNEELCNPALRSITPTSAQNPSVADGDASSDSSSSHHDSSSCHASGGGALDEARQRYKASVAALREVLIALPSSQKMDLDDIVMPGPTDRSILTQQPTHRSEEVWIDPAGKNIKMVHRRMWDMDPRIVPYIAKAGFFPWTQVQNVEADWALLTALVERWRQETHTFHMPMGECTITLQDVGLITGLPIEGDVVSGKEDHDWEALCIQLLGAYPDCPRSPTLAKRKWFLNHMKVIPDDATEEVLQRHARAYILCMLGSSLMPDLSGDRVPLHYLPLLANLDGARMYSWGSAVLGFLYRQMCNAAREGHKQMSGCIILLQLWSWERIAVGRPRGFNRTLEPVDAEIDPDLRGAWSYIKWYGPKSYMETPHGSLLFYRDQLDRMGYGDFVWRPYKEELFPLLNPACLEGQISWLCEVPLISFNVVEWCHPGRVMRQFGCKQGIPNAPRGSTDPKHGLQRKKRVDWSVELREYIDMWRGRGERMVDAQLEDDVEVPTSEYRMWYSNTTRRFIQPRFDESQSYRPTAPEHHSIVRTLVHCARTAADMFLNNDDHGVRVGAHSIFHPTVEELQRLGAIDALGVDPSIIHFDTGAK